MLLVYITFDVSGQWYRPLGLTTSLCPVLPGASLRRMLHGREGEYAPRRNLH